MNSIPAAKAFTDSVKPYDSSDWLALDKDATVLRIAGAMQEQVLRRLKRRGIVLGLQGGAHQFRRLQHHAARGAVAVGRSADGPHAARCLSRRRGGHQHEAADAEAARIFPRRPAELRGARHAEPARIRPGLLREE